MSSITKKCPKCEQVKSASLEFFPPNAKAKDGLGGYCRLCQYAANKAWRLANKEKAQEISRKWREVNREKEAARLRKHRLDNPEASRARVRKSYYKNRNKRLAARKDYRLRNLEKEAAYSKEYHRLNPPSLVSKERVGRRRAAEYGVYHENVDYAAILLECGPVCHICREVIERRDLVFDHLIPLARGGEHRATNIKPAHYVCNRKKHANIIS